MKPQLVLLFVLAALNTSAQQGVTSTGSDATGAGGTLSYSVGQVSFTTVQAQGGTSSQGVQQSYEYLILAMDAEANEASGISVSPNPTSDGVQLAFTTVPSASQRYVLLNAAGQVLHTANITSTLLHVPMADLPPATYLLRIAGGSDHTFQIIKQ